MTIEITPDTFDAKVLKADRPVLVDFWAEWCMPCRMIEPILEELSDERKEELVIGRVNVDEAGELAANYNVVSIPALLLFKDGEVIGEHVGAAPKDALVDFIQNSLK